MFWSKLIRIYRITVSGLVVKFYKAVLYIPTQNFSEFKKIYLLIFSENTLNKLKFKIFDKFLLTAVYVL